MGWAHRTLRKPSRDPRSYEPQRGLEIILWSFQIFVSIEPFIFRRKEPWTNIHWYWAQKYQTDFARNFLNRQYRRVHSRPFSFLLKRDITVVGFRFCLVGGLAIRSWMERSPMLHLQPSGPWTLGEDLVGDLLKEFVCLFENSKKWLKYSSRDLFKNFNVSEGSTKTW